MRAIVVDRDTSAGVALGERDAPRPGPSETLVRVKAIGLNPGELTAALLNRPGWRPGRDFARLIEAEAADGSGPPAGTRVVGMVNGGAFAELVAAPVDSLAVLPASVSDAEAASLPVAGLTALLGLARFGAVAGRAVVVTGASGGVGHFAVQIARASGADVAAVVRSPERAHVAGSSEVVLQSELGALCGRFDFALDSVGGDVLRDAVRSLKRQGRCVSVGRPAGDAALLDLRDFIVRGLSLEGLYVFDEVQRTSVRAGLEALVRLVETGAVRPHVGAEDTWEAVGPMVAKLVGREVPGKIVLRT